MLFLTCGTLIILPHALAYHITPENSAGSTLIISLPQNFSKCLFSSTLSLPQSKFISAAIKKSPESYPPSPGERGLGVPLRSRRSERHSTLDGEHVHGTVSHHHRPTLRKVMILRQRHSHCPVTQKSDSSDRQLLRLFAQDKSRILMSYLQLNEQAFKTESVVAA